MNWLIHTDCSIGGNIPANVKIENIGWESYIKIVSEKLGVKFNPQEKYKICDIRPAFGVIWADEIKSFDFFGYGDLDVIYGNIRNFYTAEVLESNVISSHEWCFSGHLLLLKNEEWIVHAFKKIKGWRALFEMGHNIRFDEDFFFRAFLRPNRFDNRGFKWLIWLVDRVNPFRSKYRKGIYMKEQYTTPLVPMLWAGLEVNHSCLWFWQAGKITNDTNGNREFIYIHFMNFKNSRYMDASFGANAPWSTLKKVIKVEADQVSDGFSIGLKGFFPLTEKIGHTAALRSLKVKE